MMSKDEKKANVMEIFDYKFKKKKLLEQALVTETNRKLEKLGDSIIGFLATEKGYFDVSIDNLHDYRDNLVGNKNLAEIFDEIKLKDYFLWSGGQEGDEQWEKSIDLKGDCIEAIFGAIYVDSSLQKTRKVFLAFIEKYD